MRSPASRSARQSGEAGFTLIEILCVLAIFAMLAAIILPTLPRGTSRIRLESFAIATAALLKADHNAAIRRDSEISTEVDAASRIIRSGATDRVVQIPDDVKFDALLPARCNRHSGRSAILFFSSGMSCGGMISLTRPGFGYEVRVNWLTGGVDIVPINPT
jgi:general secretion pathway protein H